MIPAWLLHDYCVTACSITTWQPAGILADGWPSPLHNIIYILSLPKICVGFSLDAATKKAIYKVKYQCLNQTKALSHSYYCQYNLSISFQIHTWVHSNTNGDCNNFGGRRYWEYFHLWICDHSYTSKPYTREHFSFFFLRRIDEWLEKKVSDAHTRSRQMKESWRDTKGKLC